MLLYVKVTIGCRYETLHLKIGDFIILYLKVIITLEIFRFHTFVYKGDYWISVGNVF